MKGKKEKWMKQMDGQNGRNIERKKICMMKERDIQKKDKDIGYR